MSNFLASNYRYRSTFAKTQPSIGVGNLISIQLKSYEEFLQRGTPVDDRRDIGLQAVFKSVFPITDFSQRARLNFLKYELVDPIDEQDEYRERGQTYAAQLKVHVRMDIYDEDGEFEASHIQHVYFGDIPLMTEYGTFIINGTERVVVSQLHRSPGVFFDLKQNKTTTVTREVLSARIIPNRGSWIDFEFDSKDVLQVRIDRRKKLPASVLLRALGYSTEELLNNYFDIEEFKLSEVGGEPTWIKATPVELLRIQSVPVDILDNDGNLICKQGKKFLKKHIKKLEKLNRFRDAERAVFGDSEATELHRVIDLPVPRAALYGRFVAEDVVNPETGEIIIPCNHPLEEENLAAALEAGVIQFRTLFIDGKFIRSSLRDSLFNDQEYGEDEAVVAIYSKLRPNDPNTPEVAKKHFNRLLFDPERYDLSRVGRRKINQRLYPNGGAPDEMLKTLTKLDLLLVVKNLYDLKNRRDGRTKDDIDHLGNRRIRSVGELLQNQFRIGLVRMEKAIKERMSLNEIANLAPNDIINSKPVTAVIKEFFGASQLSQFMDQTNPLSEVTHKRRLSALGPGGLTRERAGNEVRDVHPTHYGRICPVETPEGPNVGLIASMATYARVNEYGFLETPYLLIENGKVTGEIQYFAANEESGNIIVQASTVLDKDKCFIDENITARCDGELKMYPRDEISLMDVSPNQMVSVAASLVPFLENDDANRALMGANMQRQAVPLLKTTAPLVGTGMEWYVARDSGVISTAKREGVVTDVDATRIVIHADSDEQFGVGGDVDIYNLTKFRRSNQNTCINQKPLVQIGDIIKVGDIIADGSATDKGELALGKNIVVAFMPWQGYNFEDSILLSERLVQDDVFTSIHIEEFDVSARDTKLGKEEITSDIPNVGDEALRNLDEAGIIRVGAFVKTDDILVGKITPKGETQLTPEEKLLRAIFGEKAGDVKDSSLKARPGVEGVVMGAHVFARDGTTPDVRALEIAVEARERIERDRTQYISILRKSAKRKLISMLEGHLADNALLINDEEIFGPGDTYTKKKMEVMEFEDFDNVTVQDDPEIESMIWDTIDEVKQDKAKAIHARFDTKLARIEKGDDLPPGVIKMVKVYIAIKRKLQVGDKMAGRHGNKGVVSRVMPVENMPFLEDGTPVDIVLNPLGVPSRMNVGQVLETHLGWAARGLGVQIQKMLDGERKIEEMREYLSQIFINQPDIHKFLRKAKNAEVMELAEKYRFGVTVATPVFSGASEEEIRNLLRLAKLDDDGQTILYDGRTGEAFQNRVTVGVMYMLKLHHLVDEKIHARSIGPYSLVTQQPLGGKAQFGGQRLGEMEVWALEAYGAAYTLQEFLTVKSDDVLGRTRMYESIVKGDNVLKAGLPESFNVLVKELQALALNVDLIEHKKVLGQ